MSFKYILIHTALTLGTLLTVYLFVRYYEEAAWTFLRKSLRPSILKQTLLKRRFSLQDRQRSLRVPVFWQTPKVSIRSG